MYDKMIQDDSDDTSDRDTMVDDQPAIAKIVADLLANVGFIDFGVSCYDDVARVVFGDGPAIAARMFLAYDALRDLFRVEETSAGLMVSWPEEVDAIAAE